jgi:hypothetical protein
LGGVGSSAGRAACAMARCTRATGIAMDLRWRRAHGHAARRHQRTRSGIAGEVGEAERMDRH